MARLMEISTPLAKDVLLFQRLHATEELSRPFEYELTLLSPKKDINLDEVLGKPVSVQLLLPNDKNRYFSGFVTRFAQTGMSGRYYCYTATARPWLWFLTRTSDCRIFQEQTVPDIIKAVFADHGITDVEYKLQGKYRKWTYCVQYRETDFNFVSRLMEQEGIYYYFTHTQGRHTMVLVNSTSSHTVPFSEYGTLAYVAPDRVQRGDQEYIDSWDVTRQIQPGVYAQDDYDFERPSAELLTKKNVSRKHALGDYEIYDFPGEYLQKADGDHYAAVRMDEFSAQFELVQGTTNARGVCTGATFTLSGQTRDDQNREYLVVGASYDLEFSSYEGIRNPSPGTYRCSFTAMTTQQQFRPGRITPKPHVLGPQTAIVVGPSGDEIYTDKYGRVKVQFPWDRRGKKNENSSCWMRVSHPWAGKNWGMIAIPRMGQEVIVDFLEGDPDEPIITGRVYNAEQMPPYTLPANMTQTGTKTRSTKGGDPSNFNEIRFEDKKGSEQLFIHAEKNQDIEVEHDETHWVGHDRKKTIDNDETTHVKRNRTENVDNNEQISIGVNRTESVGKNETISIGEAQSLAVGKDQTLSVSGDRTASVDGTESITIGKDQTVTISGQRSTVVEKEDELKVNKKLTINVADEIVLKTGSASITMQKDGTITIKGKDITLDGDGNINVKAGSNVALKAGSDVNVTASGNVTMKGSKISQN